MLFEIPSPDTIQILTTQDGSVNIGRIVEIGETDVRFETNHGSLVIQKDRIKSIKKAPISALKKGQYWAPNSNATRLFLAPTARMLPRDKGYVSDHYIFFPAITFGLTNNLTIGGGVSLFPGASVEEQVFYLTPKIGLHASEKFDIAAGALILKPSSEATTAGIFYGVCTYGTPDASLTAGLGYGYIDGNMASKPVVMIGGEKRLSRRVSFVTENWIYPGEHPLISYGIRLFGESLSVDFALINILDEEAVFPGIPYIDFVFNF
jgi:hypothetical protein